jgi:hypothetical protein
VRRATLALCWLACACVLAGAARAQTPAEQVARGVRAYRDLDYDGAATILRAVLSQPAAALPDSERVRALVYLGASELYREHRDSAAVLFGRLLRIDPRYHIDQMIFPPEVTGLFQQVRLVTRAVVIVVPPVTELHAAGDALPITLYAATFHPVDVAVVRPNGVLLRTLYQGNVGDSLQVRWDGRAADGNPADSGRYLLQVDSRGGDGRVVRALAVPLDVSRVRRDTLALPVPLDDSLLKPESTPGTSGLRALVSGFVTVLAVTVLPSLVASRASGSADRFVVAGGLGVAAILGFRAERRPHPIPANIALNRALHLAWQRQADSVHAQNVARRQEVRILIRAGASRVVGSP